mmetsp:Transcript_19232/g.32040  ORF Transcript_19232/g.32040 Transcript_19232/m.32040 type:complete len:7480 (+) Transcript_19232:1-22440(+)
MKSALEALGMIGKVDVSRVPLDNGFEWEVSFTSVTTPAPRRLHSVFLKTLDAPDDDAQIEIVSVGKTTFNSLESGIPYFAQVSPHNSLGYGTARASSPLSVSPRTLAPGKVQQPSISVISSSEILVEWMSPLADGGSPVTKYELEWDISPTFDSAQLGSHSILASNIGNVNEVRRVRCTKNGGTPAGTFVLIFDGQRTDSLPVAISAVDLKAKLEALTTIRSVEVSRNVLAEDEGHVWAITFTELDYPGAIGSRLSVDTAGVTTATVSVEAARAGVVGRLPYNHIISGLATKLYYVRIAAYNALQGTGEFAATVPSAVTPALSTSLAPTEVTTTVLSSTSVSVQWGLPASVGGSQLSSFVVEVDTLDSFDTPGLRQLTHNVNAGTPYPTSIVVYDLIPGVKYHFRVYAVNGIGNGLVRIAEPSPVHTAGLPDVVDDVVLRHDFASPGGLLVEYNLPHNNAVYGNNGEPLEKVTAQYAARINEVQSLKITGSDTDPAASFRLRFAGADDTVCIRADATAANIELALENLPSIDGVAVTTRPEECSSCFLIEFTGESQVNGDVEQLEPRDVGSGTCVSPTVGTISATIETVTAGKRGFVPHVFLLRTHATATIGGTFSLSFDYFGDFSSSTITGTATVDPKSRVVTTSASWLDQINRGDYVEIRGEIHRVSEEGVSFDSDEVTLDSFHRAGATGVTAHKMSTAVGTVSVESGKVNVGSPDLTGVISLGDAVRIGSHETTVAGIDEDSITLTHAYTGETDSKKTIYVRKKTGNLGDASTAVEVKDALELLPGIGSVDVSRFGADEFGGYSWLITFTSFYGAGTCGAGVYKSGCLTVHSSLTGTNAAADITTVKEGIAPEFTSLAGTVPSISRVSEIQTITSTATGGTFTVDFEASGAPVSVAYDVTSKDMKHWLERLSTIGRVDVTKTTPTTGTSVWEVKFLTNIGDVKLLDVNGAGVSGGTVVAAEKTRGVVPKESLFLRSDVSEGSAYHVRVGVETSVGAGAFTDSVQSVNWNAPTICPTAAPVDEQCSTAPLYSSGGVIPGTLYSEREPAAPANLVVSQYSRSQLSLQWDSPVANIESFIDKYRVVAFPKADVTFEVQTISVSCSTNDLAGTFKLDYSGESTRRISWNADVEEMQNAINELTDIAGATVSMEEITNGHEWAITFANSYGNMDELTIDKSGLVSNIGVISSSIASADGVLPLDFMSFELDADTTACSSSLDSIEQGPCFSGSNEIQTIVVEGNSATVTGDIILRYNVAEASIAVSATAAQLKDTLETLTGMEGLIVEKWDGSANGQSKIHWYVTFPRQFGRVLPIIAEAEELVGFDAQVNVYETVTVTSSSQRDDITGSFVLHIGSESTASLAEDASDSFVQTQLELLNSIGRVEVRSETSKRILDVRVSVGNTDTSIVTTRDLCDEIAPTETFWVNGVSVTRHASNPCTGNSLPLSVAWNGEEVVGSSDVTVSAFGLKRYILLKVVTLDEDIHIVESFRATPNPDWKGTGVQLAVNHPVGRDKNSFIIGARAEIQTIRTRGPVYPGDTAEYKVSFNGVDSGCIPWNADATTMKNILEGSINLIDRVSVTVEGDGTEASLFGHLYTIHFWGDEMDYAVVPELTLKGIGAGVTCVDPDNTDADKMPSVLIHTVREGYALASMHPQYVALNANTKYHVEVSARSKNLGYGPAVSTELSTPLLATTPLAPSGLRAGRFYTESSASISYTPPLHDGGSLITTIEVEWDTSEHFDSPYRQHRRVEMVDEVQRITTSARADDVGGSFTLSWGGRTTPDLDYNIGAATLAEEIQVITGAFNEGTNPIKVTKEALGNGFEWMVTFTGIHGNVGLLLVDHVKLTGYDAKCEVTEVRAGSKDIYPGKFTLEKQIVQTKALSDLSGSFTLTFEGDTTGDIDYNADESAMKTSLEALSTIHTVNVKQFIAQDPTKGVVWEIEFTHLKHEVVQGAGNIGLLQADTTKLAGVNKEVLVSEMIQGTNPFSLWIDGLDAGTTYYVRVSAFNMIGFGPTSSVVSFKPVQRPQKPLQPVLTVDSSTSLKLSFNTPDVGSSGIPVDSMFLEWYTSDGISAEQTITTSALEGIAEVQTITSFADGLIQGKFRVRFKGELSEEIYWNDDPSTVESKLERMATIGNVAVTRDFSKVALPGVSNVAGSTLTCTTSCFGSLSRGDDIWVAGRHFKVCQNTGNCPEFTNTQLRLASVDTPGTAELFGTAPNGPIKIFKSGYGYDWTVTFGSGHVGDQPLLEAVPSPGWQGPNVVLYTKVIRDGLQPLSGTFRLAYKDPTTKVSDRTPALPYDISSEDLKAELERLNTISLVDVSRFKNGYGYDWYVKFVGHTGAVGLLTVDSSQLTGPSASALVAQTRAGTLPSSYGSHTFPTASAGSFTYSIPGLNKGQSYSARVTGVNSEGLGVTSDAASPMTPSGTPDAPTNVQVMSLSDTQIKVVWTAPLDNGGLVVGKYLIEWDITANFANIETSGYTHTLVVPAGNVDTTFHYNIPLTTGHSYFVRIRAENARGMSVATSSAPNSAKPKLLLPSQPHTATLTVLSGVQLRVDWEAPNPNLHVYGGDGGNQITSYLVEWDTDFAQPPAAQYAIVDGSKRSYIIGERNILTGSQSSPLIEGETYEARVTAINAMGHGPPIYTVPDSQTTANQVPQKPENAVASVASSTAVTLRWDLPSSDGGRSLESLQIDWDPSTDFDSLQSISISATNTLTDGQYKLEFGPTLGQCMDFGLTPEQFASALETDFGTHIVDVSVTRTEQPESNGHTYFVKFHNPVEPPYDLVLSENQDGCDAFAGGVETIQTSSTSSGSITIPILHESQVVATKADVVNEVQEITATVQVTNERQTITSSVLGVDEVQTVTTDALDVIPEIQTLTTSTTDVDEKQVIALSAADINELQTITTSAKHVDEIQVIRITGTKVEEQQVLKLDDMRKTQVLDFTASGVVDMTSAVQVVSVLEPRKKQVVTVEASSQIYKRSEVQILRITCDVRSSLTGKFRIRMDSTSTSGPGQLLDAAQVWTSGDIDATVEDNSAVLAALKGSPLFDTYKNDFDDGGNAGSVVYFQTGGTKDYTITYPKDYGNVPRIELIDGSAGNELGGTTNIVLQVQQVTDGVCGAYKLQYNGADSTCIRYDESNSVIQAKLEAVAGITSVSVSRDTDNEVADRKYIPEITFNDPASPVALVVLSNPVTTGCDDFHCGSENTACSTETIVLQDLNLGGTFKLRFNTETQADCPLCKTFANGLTGTIDPLSVSDLKTELEGLPNIDVGDIVVDRNPQSDGEGYLFSVTFSGPGVKGKVPQMVVVDDLTTGDNTDVSVAMPTPGVYPGIKLQYANGGANQVSRCVPWNAAATADPDSPNGLSIQEIIATLDDADGGALAANVEQDSVSSQDAQYTISLTSPSNPDNLTPLEGGTCQAFTCAGGGSCGGGAIATIDNTNLAGTFQLVADTTNCNLCAEKVTKTTDPIDPNVADSLQTALNALSNVNVVVTEAAHVTVAGEGKTWTITYKTGMDGNMPEQLLTVTSNSLTGDSPALPANPTTTVQGNEIDLEGTYILEYDDTLASVSTGGGAKQSGTIEIQAPASGVSGTSIKEKLESMANIFAPVSVTATPLTDGVGGVEYTVTFLGNDGNMPTLSCESWTQNSLKLDTATYGVAPGTDIDCSVVDSRHGNFIGGAFTVQWNNLPDTPVSIAWDEEEDDVKTKLSAIPGIGTLDVTRTPYRPAEDLNSWTGGYVWTVEFVDLASNTLPITVVSTDALTEVNPDGAASKAATVFEFRPGNVLGGQYKLAFRSKTGEVRETAYIGWNDSGDDVMDALKLLNNIDDVAVTRSATGPSGGSSYTVTFTGADVGGDVSELYIPDTCQSVQTLTTTSDNLVNSGTYTIRYGGASTACLSWHASQQEVEDAIKLLAGITNVFVETTGAGDLASNYGYTHKVQFQDPMFPTTSFTIDFDDCAAPVCSGGCSETTEWANTGSCNELTGTAATYDVSTIVIGNELQGTFMISYNGENTAPMTHDVGFTDMKNAIETHPFFGEVEVSMTQANTVAEQTETFTWSITFSNGGVHDGTDHGDDNWDSGYSKAWGENVGNIANIGCVSNGLSAKSEGQTAVCTVAEFREGSIPLGGFFTLTLDSSDSDFMNYRGTQTSDPIAHNAPSTQAEASKTGRFGFSVEELLEKMLNVGDVDVQRSDVDEFHVGAQQAGSYRWSITFLEDTCSGDQLCLSAGDVPDLGVNVGSLLGSSRTGVSNEVTKGNILRGTFKISLGGVYTVPLSWDASAEEVDAAMEAIPAVSRVEVESARVTKYGARYWAIRFTENPGETPPGAGDIDDIVLNTDSMLETNAGNTRDFDIVEVQKGSTGLSGTFSLTLSDTSDVARVVSFDEDPAEMERKLNEMSVSMDVHVSRSVYPSATSGGWGAVAVNPDAQLGGYIWKVTFLRNPGVFEGETWPPGSGDQSVMEWTTGGSLLGTESGVAVAQSTGGSAPLAGYFVLNYDGAKSDGLSYDISDTDLKTQLELIDTIGEVSVHRSVAFMEALPGTASIEIGSSYITATGNLWGEISRGDLIRVGGANGLGENGINDIGITGDSLITQGTVSVTEGSSTVTTSSNLRPYIAEGDRVRIDTDIYRVTSTGVEIQKIVVSGASSGQYKLRFLDEKTDCIDFDATDVQLEATLENLLDIDAVYVSREYVTANSGYTYSIFFVGDLFDGDVSNLVMISNECIALDAGSAVASQVQAGLEANKLTLHKNFQGDTNMVSLIYAVPPVFTVLNDGVEVQTLTLKTTAETGTITQGQYKIQYNTRQTSCLSYSTAEVDVAAVESAIEGILADDGITENDVSVTRRFFKADEPGTGFVYSVYFTGKDMITDMDQLTLTVAGCATAFVPAVTLETSTITEGSDDLSGPIRHEVQRVTITDERKTQTVHIDVSDRTKVQAATVMLRYNGQDSACVAWDAAELTMKNAIEGIPSLGGATVTSVTQVATPMGYEYVVVFAADTSLHPLEVSPNQGDCVETNLEVFTVNPDNMGTGMTLTFDTTLCSMCTVKGSHTTLGIDPALELGDASLLERLYKLPNIGDYEVEVSRATHTGSPVKEGYIWDITFSGNTVQGDVPQLVVSKGSMTGDATATVAATTITQGNADKVYLGTVNVDAGTEDVTTGNPNTRAVYSSWKKTGLNVYKVSGHRWTVKFDSNLGDLPDFVGDVDALVGTERKIVAFEAMKGVLPDQYTVTGLETGLPYAFRVALANSLGLGDFSTENPVQYPRGVPDAPVLLAADIALHVDEVQSVTVAASHINEIQTVSTTCTDVREVQTIKTTKADGPINAGTMKFQFTDKKGRTFDTSQEKRVVRLYHDSGDGQAASVGGFKLRYDGDIAKTTSCLDHNAEESEMKSALEALTGITTVEVVRTWEESDSAYSFTVVFINPDTGVSTLTVVEGPEDGSPCRAWVPIANTYKASTSTLDAAGEDLDYQMTPEQLKQQLDKLPNLKSVETQRSIVDSNGGYLWTVGFESDGGNLNPMICTSSGEFVCTVDTVTDGNELGGFFTLQFASESTVNIPFDATTNVVKDAIEALGGGSKHTVEVTQSLDNEATRAYTWTVVFTSDIGDLGIMTATNSLTGSGASIRIAETTKGNWLSGSFTLSYKLATTPDIPYDADAETVKGALESLGTIKSVVVTDTSLDTQRGKTWMVTFTSPTNGGDLELMQSSTTKLNGVGKTVLVREVVKGAEATGTKAVVTFDAPPSDGGEALTEYRLDIDISENFDSGFGQWYTLDSPELLYRTQQVTVSATPRPEVQEVKILEPSKKQTLVVDADGVMNQGHYVLSYNGRKTTCIPFDASNTIVSDAIDAAVEAFDGTENAVASVAATGDATDGFVYSITFAADAGIYQLQLEGLGAAVGCNDDFQCGGGTCPSATPVTVTPDAITGDFTLSFDTNTFCVQCFDKTSDETTLAIDPNVADSVQTELNKLPNIGPNGVTVTTVQHSGSIGHGKTFRITFSGGSVTGNVPQVTFVGNLGGVNPQLSVETTQQGEEFGGTFTLVYGSEETSPLPYDATAEQVRDALEGLSTLETVSVTQANAYVRLPGSGEVSKGIPKVTTTGAMGIYRGDILRVHGETFRIGKTGTFDESEAPLATMDNYAVFSNFIGEGVSNRALYQQQVGYTFTVVIERTANGGSPGPISAARHSLAPDSSFVKIRGGTDFVLEADSSMNVGCQQCFYIPNLQAGTKYYTKLSAKNSMGKSVDSNILEIVPKQLPSAPQNVYLSAVSSTSLLVEFEPGSNPGGDTVIGYDVEYDTTPDFNSNNGGPLGVVNVGESSIQGTPPYHAFITELSVATEYFVRVASKNSVPRQVTDPLKLAPFFGYNTNWQTTDPGSIVTADQAPLAPFAVDVSLVSGSVVRVVTTSPDRDGGVELEKLRIEWDPSSTFQSLDGSLPFCSTEQVINGNALLSQLSSVPKRWIFDIGASVINHALTGIDCQPLVVGVPYYVRVAAYNGVGESGYGAYYTTKVPVAPMQAPGSPADVSVTTEVEQDTPIKALDVTWTAPSVDGGSEVTSYRVEWWIEKPQYEVQSIWVVNSEAGGTGGKFSLLFNGQASIDVDWDVSPEDLRFALMNLNNWNDIGNIKVDRVPIADKGFRWDVTFLDIVKNTGNQPPLMILGTNLVETSGVVSAYTEERLVGARTNGNNEVQKVVSDATGGQIDGFFRLSLDGSDWSPLLPYDVSKEDLEAALESLVSVGTVTCSVLAGPGAKREYSWLVTFDSLGTLGSWDIPKLQVDSSYLVSTAELQTASITVHDGDNMVANINKSPPAAPDSKIVCTECKIGETPVQYGYAIVGTDDDELKYTIGGLDTGTEYRVRVVAGNEQGYGEPSTLVANTPPLQVPNPPTDVVLSVKDGDSSALEIEFNAPTSDGGDAIRMYTIQYDTVAGFSSAASAGLAGKKFLRCSNFPLLEVVTIETKIDGASTTIESGDFKLELELNGQVVSMDHGISWDAPAMAVDESGADDNIYCFNNVLGACTQTNRRGSMESHLNILTRNLGLSGGVSVTRTDVGATKGYVWTVTFLDTVNGFDLRVVDNSLVTDAGGTPAESQVLVNTMTEGATYSNCVGRHTLEGLTQGRMYFARVFAYNSRGYSIAAEAPTPAKPMKVPSPPTDVRLSVISGTSLRVVFSPDDDGGDTITKYLIEYDTQSDFKSGNKMQKEHLYLDGGAPFSVTLSSLTMGQSYYVRVAAHNARGYGAFESSSPASEKPMQVPTAPTNIQFLITSDSKLTVKFDDPVNTGGDDITYYKIIWDRDVLFSSLYELPHKGYADVAASVHKSYTINDLANVTAYFVKVQARNSMGFGPTGLAVPTNRAPIQQLPGKPHNVGVAAGDVLGTIDVTFNAPRVPDHGVPCSGGGPTSTSADEVCATGMGRDHGTFGEADGGSAIIRYIIEWDVQSDFVSTNSAPHKSEYFLPADDTDSFSHRISGLSSGRRYYVRVYAENAVGVGKFQAFDVDGAQISIKTN